MRDMDVSPQLIVWNEYYFRKVSDRLPRADSQIKQRRLF